MDQLTQEQQDTEFDLLKLANKNGKFAIHVGYLGSDQEQFALERLQLRRWITLIDVSPASEMPGRLFRVFVAEPEALAWFKEEQIRRSVTKAQNDDR